MSKLELLSFYKINDLNEIWLVVKISLSTNASNSRKFTSNLTPRQRKNRIMVVLMGLFLLLDQKKLKKFKIFKLIIRTLIVKRDKYFGFMLIFKS